MYAKIFAQIFDSSIAENYAVRHVFEDLLKLADQTGVVDMTMEAIARRTNGPIDTIRMAIDELSKPDSTSRSKLHGGRRIIPLDSNRNWGWIIVNYEHYREIQDEQTRKSYFRDAKRRQRERESTKGMNGKQKLAYQKGKKAVSKIGVREAEKMGRIDTVVDLVEEANAESKLQHDEDECPL